jgi:gamma-glutamyltranspeptidase/glutathione hydrolase
MKQLCAAALSFLAVITCLALTGEPALAEPQSGVWARNGMVVSQSSHATEAGLEILKRGGNAVDAAVAVSLALGVTEQYHCGIGGGGFILLYLAESGRLVAIDAREKAPALAARDMFKGAPEKSREGALAVAVPGLLAGLDMALGHYGTMSLAEVIAPSIRLAREGFAIGYSYSKKIEEKEEKLKRHPESARIYFLSDGKRPAPDHVLIQEDLARTYETIAAGGAGAMYGGALGERIARFIGEEGGIVSGEDLTSYRAVVREPVTGTYRGYHFYSMPPPSSGGVHLIQILNVLEGYDLGTLGFGSSSYLHHLAEAMKWAFRDRASCLGDPDFADVPVGRLISKEYAAEFRAMVREDTVLVLLGEGLCADSGGHTSHLSVVDRWGNAVALSQTVNLDFGSGLTVPGTGIILNDEMDDFAAEPGVPNAFGLVGAEANSVRPGKRPLSSMTPTIVTKDGALVMVLGSPGGGRIITAVLQVLLNVIDFGMPVGDAVAAPRAHHQWKPDELLLERWGFGKDVVKALESKGHRVGESGAMGSVQAILIDRKEGYLFGSADGRLEGTAAGY